MSGSSSTSRGAGGGGGSAGGGKTRSQSVNQRISEMLATREKKLNEREVGGSGVVVVLLVSVVVVLLVSVVVVL